MLQKTMAEGAGAAGLAAVISDPDRFAGRKVGLVLAGGNIDPRLAASIMVRELAREEQVVAVRIFISDRPGVLGEIARTIGAEGGNILEVSHRPHDAERAAQGRDRRRDDGDARRRARRRNHQCTVGEGLSGGAARSAAAAGSAA